MDQDIIKRIDEVTRGLLGPDAPRLEPVILMLKLQTAMGRLAQECIAPDALCSVHWRLLPINPQDGDKCDIAAFIECPGLCPEDIVLPCPPV